MALLFSLIIIKIVLKTIFIFSCTITSVSAAASGGNGFTVELIHRDSPKSPMYDPSETHYHRLAKTLRRSFHPNTAVDTAEAPINSYKGEYLMKISIGTPPFPIIAVADTGSDVIWTQCQPCPNCYHQNSPMFDPSKSLTYNPIPCSSPICSFAGRVRSCSNRSECLYSIIYNDKSHSRGVLAVDTVTMGSTSGRHVAFPRTVIGCGHDNVVTFDNNVSGIVGLGQGPGSLIPQMGPSSGGKFSYCLVPLGGSVTLSKLSFGSNADVSGLGVVSTPIYTNGRFGFFYSLNIEAMSIGKNKFNFPISSPLDKQANMAIDSGTTLTLLPPSFYTNIATSISNSTNLQRMDDPNQFLEYCFETMTNDFEAPSITMHFEGADVSLHRENLFVRVADNVVCLALGTVQDEGISIYGNIAQSNFLVGYDIKNKFVSFKQANCAAM